MALFYKPTIYEAEQIVKLARLRRALLTLIYDKARLSHPSDILPYPEVWPDEQVVWKLWEILKL